MLFYACKIFSLKKKSPDSHIYHTTGEGYEKLWQRKDNGKDNMVSLFKGYLHNETIK